MDIVVTQLQLHSNGRVKAVMAGTCRPEGDRFRYYVPKGYPNTFAVSKNQQDLVDRGEHVLLGCSGGVHGGIVLYVIGKTAWHTRTSRDYKKLEKTLFCH